MWLYIALCILCHNNSSDKLIIWRISYSFEDVGIYLPCGPMLPTPHRSLNSLRGTGMAANSSTFCPHLWRFIRDMFRHGSTSLQQLFKGSCSRHMSSNNLWVNCQFTLAPPLNSGANAAKASVQALPVQALPVQYQ